ncbi:MAG TPA: glycosyl hydrolase family 32 [Planosporangium sp.]|jgi:beta-fructofuranosidase|nr:glycosyl hydrolase family 32 [Planosporangium sp.]
MLRLPDHWVWDSWLAVDRGLYHLFFLRASRALLDPERRHLRASIGHAVSTDLRSWELVPDALVHADAPTWDDQAVWTGSVVRGPDGQWYLFYTGVTRQWDASLQRIGAAVSDDLLTWHRVGPQPLVQADRGWYECVDLHPGVSESWRDPFVFADPAGDGWHMVLTARARARLSPWRGVIGHARSHDLLDWEVQPPLTAPAGFGDLEIPQVQFLDGRGLLIFSCPPQAMSAERRAGLTHAGTWTVLGNGVADGWDLASAVPFAHPSLYGGRLIRDGSGHWCLLGFRQTENGVFHGEILDPIPVAWENGRLVEAGRA